MFRRCAAPYTDVRPQPLTSPGTGVTDSFAVFSALSREWERSKTRALPSAFSRIASGLRYPYNLARTCFGLMPNARLNAVEKLAALL